MTINLKAHQNELLFIPLGGSGEIGLNLNLYHYNGSWIMLDCGCGFADAQLMPGVDILVPDISFIIDSNIKIEAIILTHAHEDHIGAVCYLWQVLSCPVYGTKFATEFLRAKLRDFEFCNEVPIMEIPSKPEQKFHIGAFTLEAVSLTHSVPEMQAIVISTPKGNVLHTGDWKIDPDPVVGPTSAEARLREIGDAGVLAMVCDSTNAMSKGWSKSEGALVDNLTEIISQAKKMVVITTFASNIARIHTIASIAQKLKKDLFVSGTALNRIIGVAQKSGYLLDYEFNDIKHLNRFDRNKVMLLCTGCQGEVLATTAKLANDTHRFCKIQSGDTIIFSSRIIPGNDKKIFAVFNKLVEIGAKIIHEKDHFVHVSGHPNRDELKYMYEIVRPQVAIPVHGEAIHLQAHVDLAQECNIKQAILIRNGDVIKLDAKGGQKIGQVFAGQLGVDGFTLLEAKNRVLQERQHLRDCGIIICSFIINRAEKIVCQPQMISIGCFDTAHNQDLMRDLEQRVANIINKKVMPHASHRSKNTHDKDGIYEVNRSQKPDKKHLLIHDVKSSIRQLIRHQLGINPMVEVVYKVI